MWFDTMVIFSAALSGLALFYVTLFSIRNVLELIWGRLLAEITIILVAFLCSFGIYLGRYLRFNSWDVLSSPHDLLVGIANPIFNPTVHARAIGVTLLYGTFLLVGYWVIKLFQMGDVKPGKRPMNGLAFFPVLLFPTFAPILTKRNFTSVPFYAENSYPRFWIAVHAIDCQACSRNERLLRDRSLQ